MFNRNVYLPGSFCCYQTHLVLLETHVAYISVAVMVMFTGGEGVAELQTAAIAICRGAGTSAETDAQADAAKMTDALEMAGADADSVDLVVTASSAGTVIMVDAPAETWTVVDVTVTVPFCNTRGSTKAFLILFCGC